MADSKQILSYVSGTDSVTAECVESFGVLLEAYPYFQSAHYLYLKALKQTDNEQYRRQLSKTVFYTSDRPHLYTYLQTEAPTVSPTVEKIETEKRPQLSMIDTFLSDFQAVNNGELLYSLPVDVMTELKEMPDRAPIQSDSDSKQNEWIDRFIQADQVQGWRSIHQESGEKELPAETKKTESATAIETKSEPQSTLEEGALSESLARIYIKQKKYEAALEIIEKLSLKYPEKNCYFADQIRFLKKLIINIKS